MRLGEKTASLYEITLVPVSCENGDPPNGDPGSPYSRENGDPGPYSLIYTANLFPGVKVQNNIGWCSIKSLTCNFCFPPPPDNFETQVMHWLLPLKKILARHQSHSVYKSFEVNIMHHTALRPVSLVRSHKMLFNVSPPVQSTSPVH